MSCISNEHVIFKPVGQTSAFAEIKTSLIPSEGQKTRVKWS